MLFVINHSAVYQNLIGSFHNIDFDWQRIIGNYIVDFYIKTLGLIIEIDGNSHDNKVEYDVK